ncbi:MAG: hypothetical protein IIT65_07775, partial [Lachnospiraceae bacterium]|nr:hypothetical protein [Lachnospiraceae bacterium]
LHLNQARNHQETGTHNAHNVVHQSNQNTTNNPRTVHHVFEPARHILDTPVEIKIQQLLK